MCGGERNGFSVMTLNVWGLPLGICSDKSKRIEAIGQAIAGSNYDVVCLQELWCKNDFIIIKNLVKETHPHHHYFHSGIIGSGLCIFSKWTIAETFYYAFPINGLFHMVHHGDWFGGKGIGLAHINIYGVKVYVYNTHLHADYSNGDGGKCSYFAHRLVQAFDTALFIKHTSGCADLAILAGDFNSADDDTCTKLIRGLADLEDAWEVAEKKVDSPETSDCHRNSYRSKKLSSECTGQRLDYILFKTKHDFKVSVAEYEFPLDARIPGTDISYSDHEAVRASFHFTESSGIDSSKRLSSVLKVKENLLEQLCISMETCRAEVRRHLRDIYTFLLFIVLLFVGMIIVPLSIDDHSFIKAYFLIVTTVICFETVLIFTRLQDMAWLKNAKKRLKVYVKALAANPLKE